MNTQYTTAGRDDQNPGDEIGDLDFLAFRYVAGELSADEATLFEEALAEDQSAREAVARAVQTTDAVLVLSRTPSVACPARRSSWSERSWGMAIGATAAAALIAVGWQFLATDIAPVIAPIEVAKHNQAVTAESVKEANAVVALWSQPGLVDAHDAAEQAGLEHHDADEGDLRIGEASQEIEVPGWLLAAVSTNAKPAEVLPEEN